MWMVRLLLKSSDNRVFCLVLNEENFLARSILKHSLPLFLLSSFLKNFKGEGSRERMRLGLGLPSFLDNNAVGTLCQL